MYRYFIFFTLILTLRLQHQAKADTWEDPTWETMLEKSDVIALIEYTNNGDFRAAAKIVKSYKGSLKTGDKIWISGFSNRYGPIDKANKGDKYIVFLNVNKPNKKNIAYWNKELKTKPELKEYVSAYKKRKSYSVWSPTSGDLKIKEKTIQYDLTQTSFYSKQNYYPLEQFEKFLITYINKSTDKAFVNDIISKLTPFSENELTCQYFMQLNLLHYSTYHSFFSAYVNASQPANRYALAKLMSNIDSEQSRTILITLLDDKNSIVQGEAVRSLKNGPVDIIAPILLSHLKTAGSENIGPSNIMNPLTNKALDGGKVEIIKTLGELNYKPAIPELLPILDTDNDELFTLVIEVLKKMNCREYITYINKHLDQKTDNLIYEISKLIVAENLTECLPSYKHFITTCNRNKHPSYSYTLLKCCGLGHFNDSTSISFLLSDFKHFFTYKDTLDNSKQKDWTNAYIETFTKLKVKEARPIIYNAIYDWCGLNEDFGKNQSLYTHKRNLEDSLKKTFERNLQGREFKWDHCIAFIENTTEISQGTAPKANYQIQVTVPTTEASEGNGYVDLIAKELNLPRASVFIRFSDGVYFNAIQNRFDKEIMHTPLYSFIDFARAVPTHADIAFLQSLLDSKSISESYEQEKIKEAIKDIKSAIKKR
jgi:hypothetical protein